MRSWAVEQPPEQLVPGTILRARDFIERYGWVRGALCREDGYCIVGAILAVQKNIDVQTLAFESIRYVCGYLYVTKWNDEAAENRRAVNKILTRAAAHARSLLIPRKEPRMAGMERGSIYTQAERRHAAL